MVIDPLDYVHSSFREALRIGLINTMTQLLGQKAQDDMEIQKVVEMEDEKDVGRGTW